MEKKKKKIHYCRLSRYTAIFEVDHKLLNHNAQVMGKDIDEIGLWSELTPMNLGIVKLDKTIVDFVIRERCDEPVITEDVYNGR